MANKLHCNNPLKYPCCDDNDSSEIDNLMKILRKPYDEHPAFEHYAGHHPDWAQQIELSCSS